MNYPLFLCCCCRIQVDEEYRGKISEFGLGQLRTAHFSAAGGDIPLWSAPEVIMGAAPTPAADVYSFGIVMWEVHTHTHARTFDIQSIDIHVPSLNFLCPLFLPCLLGL
jgi:serine/threonine protein kinase